MKNIVCSFIQYLGNNDISGNKKVMGFVLEGKEVTLYLSKMPTITEWLNICEIWQNQFEQHSLSLKTK